MRRPSGLSLLIVLQPLLQWELALMPFCGISFDYADLIVRGHPSRLTRHDILQKHSALLAYCSAGQSFCGCLMVLMHHLNADLENREGVVVVGENRDPCGENMLGIWKSDVSGVSGGEEFSPNTEATLDWNIKCSNRFQGSWSVTKRRVHFSNQDQTYNNPLHIFQGGFCQDYSSLRKKLYSCTDVQQICDETTSLQVSRRLKQKYGFLQWLTTYIVTSTYYTDLKT